MPTLPTSLSPMSEDTRETVIAALLVAGTTAAAGWLAERAVNRLWGRKGRVVPTVANATEVSLPQAIAFAAVSGAVATIAQTLATRTALAQATRRGLIHRPEPEVAIEV